MCHLVFDSCKMTISLLFIAFILVFSPDLFCPNKPKTVLNVYKKSNFPVFFLLSNKTIQSFSGFIPDNRLKCLISVCSLLTIE